MAMDALRTCNHTLATLADGSQVWLRWYITDDDAPAYPYAHAYGHPVWEGSARDRDEFVGAGCLARGWQWVRNGWPGPLGFCPEGSPSDFAGIVVPARPIPSEVCGVPVQVAYAGGVLSGLGWVQWTAATSSPCACGTASTSSAIGVAATSSACVCASPATAAIVGPTATSSACVCASPATAAMAGPSVASSPCVCGIAATSSATGIEATSSTCACGTATTTATIVTAKQAWWPSGGPPPVVQQSGGLAASLPYSSGTGDYRGSYGGGTLVWSGSAAGGSPSGYYGALAWIYGGTTYTASITSYLSSSATGDWSFPGGTPGITSPVTVLQGAAGGASSPCACGTATTTTAAYGTTTGCSACPGGSPTTWSLVVSGMTGSYAALNGTWTFSYVSGCTWQAGSIPPQWALLFSAGTWSLHALASGSVQIIYILSGGTWQCLGSNTLTYSSGTGTGSHPATLTVTPG